MPITVLLYNGWLLCGFNVAISGLSPIRKKIDIDSQSYSASDKMHNNIMRVAT